MSRNFKEQTNNSIIDIGPNLNYLKSIEVSRNNYTELFAFLNIS